MQLLDVNVLLYAARRDAPDHSKFVIWLEDLINSGESFATSEFILSSFIRIATNPKAFKQPSTTTEAFESGSEWISTDGDYARFQRLIWRHPFATK